MEAASGNTVLIIEDERDVVDLLALNLRKAGFATSTAPDGAAGLEKARSEKPSLIILDLMLPKMPGLEVCKILKTDPGTRQVPIMMLTAKAEEIDRIVGWNWRRRLCDKTVQSSGSGVTHSGNHATWRGETR